MERTVEFNDEFVAPKIEALVEIGIGKHTISPEQIEKVKELLNIAGDDIEGLRAKRNSCVKLLAKEEDKYYNNQIQDFKNFDRYHNTLSGVTFVIDSRIWDLGGEC